MLTLSLIIPVYNEENQIRACLEAVKKQQVTPYEVLVIDNNCTDNTIAIAQEFSFVTVLKEPVQGLIYARNTGFNAAKGDILGRIDADSVLDPEWSKFVIQNFEKDPYLQGLTGIARTSYLPYFKQHQAVFLSKVYFMYVESRFRHVILWGANMSIRASAWRTIRKEVCLDATQVHEDQDLSCLMAGHAMKCIRSNRCLMKSYDQSIGYLPKFIHYDLLWRNTKKIHTKNGNLAQEKYKITNKKQIFMGFFIGFLVRIYILLFGGLYSINEFLSKKLLRRK